MVSGRSHAKNLQFGWFWPKTTAECHAAGEVFPGISAPFATDDCGCGEMLSPSHSTQEKVGTRLASQDEKIPPYFSMPWAPPVKGRSSISQ